jgi:hypothetical protein
MNAKLLPGAEVTIDILGKNISPDEIAETREFASMLSTSSRTIVEHYVGPRNDCA